MPLHLKYKASNIGNTENNGTKNRVKIAVPLKYLSNFWWSLEMPLIKLIHQINSSKKYFLPRAKIENYKIEIDGIKFYEQSINDSIKQYDEVMKIPIGQGDDYTTGCLLDFAYFEKNYRLIAADLSKQKALDADSRAIQQTIFTGKIKSTEAKTWVIIYYILE